MPASNPQHPASYNRAAAHRRKAETNTRGKVPPTRGSIARMIFVRRKERSSSAWSRKYPLMNRRMFARHSRRRRVFPDPLEELSVALGEALGQFVWLGLSLPPADDFRFVGWLTVLLVPPIAPRFPITSEVLPCQPHEGNLRPPAGVDVAMINERDEFRHHCAVAKDVKHSDGHPA